MKRANVLNVDIYKFSTCIHITLLTLFQRFVAKYCPYNRDCVRKFVLKALSVSGYKGVRLREQHLLRNAYALAGRRKIVRTKGVSAYEECPLRESTLYIQTFL